MIGNVEAVSRSEVLSFSKTNCEHIDLMVGLGVKNEASKSSTIGAQIRTVRILSMEIIRRLRERGFRISPGVMGEHITTKGIDISELSPHMTINIGPDVEIRLVASRREAARSQGNGSDTSRFNGLTSDDYLLSRSCVEGLVIRGGRVRPSDTIQVQPVSEMEHIA